MDVRSNDVGIGIDLGTTYSCCSIYRNGAAEMIPDYLSLHNSNLTPSVVAFEDNSKLVGDAAKSALSSSPLSTIFDTKRIIGRRALDENLEADRKLWPFQIDIEDPDQKVRVAVPIGGKLEKFLPEEVGSFILKHMKESAEARLGQRVTSAVITTPARFSENQVAATKIAGELAGLKVLKIIYEPTAAALAHGFRAEVAHEGKNLLVYDLGGGTFDVTLLRVEGRQFRVIRTGGDEHLGGQDFDANIMKDILGLMKLDELTMDITNNQIKLQRLRLECETAKKQLTNRNSYTISVGGVLPDGKDFTYPYSRAEFEEANEEEFRRTLLIVKQVIEGSGLEPEQIQSVILIGGSSKIPKIRELLRDFFKMAERGMEFPNFPNPDEAVCQGAAIEAARLLGDQDPQILSYALFDVTPLNLGIKIKGNIVDWIIMEGTQIPWDMSRVYYTTVDYQEVIGIKIYQGRRKEVEFCVLIEEFLITDIPIKRKGEVGVLVTFDINESGLLSVKAINPESASEGSVSVNLRMAMSKEKVDDLKQKLVALDERLESLRDDAQASRGIKRGRENLNASANNVAEASNTVEAFFPE